MSDEFILKKAFPPGIVEHLCEHPGCKEWGAWGYSRMKEEPRWFCTEHRDEGERFLGRHDG